MQSTLSFMKAMNKKKKPFANVLKIQKKKYKKILSKQKDNKREKRANRNKGARDTQRKAEAESSKIDVVYVPAKGQGACKHFACCISAKCAEDPGEEEESRGVSATW